MFDLPLKPNKKNFFDAWDDHDQIDTDKTTEMILAEKETFDILASRGYETLEEFPSEQKAKKPMQKY